MIVSLIAAVSRNHVIGRGGGLPWHLPDDLRHFMRTTSGHVIIMGRRTWESMDGPLPNRTNVVVSRTLGDADGADVVASLDEAYTLAEERGETEAFVCGGSGVYEAALAGADRMYITHVDADVDGDTYFPRFDEDEWKVTREQRHEADDRHAHAFTVRVWERR